MAKEQPKYDDMSYRFSAIKRRGLPFWPFARYSTDVHHTLPSGSTSITHVEARSFRGITRNLPEIHQVAAAQDALDHLPPKHFYAIGFRIRMESLTHFLAKRHVTLTTSV